MSLATARAARPATRVVRTAVAALLALDLIASTLFVAWAEQGKQNPVRVDSIIAVLYADSFELGENTTRTLAASLLFESPNTRYLCVGGAREVRKFFGAQDMVRWFQARGIPSERLYVDLESYDSSTNLASITRWRGQQEINITAVTDSLHAMRMRRIVERMQLDWLQVYGFSLWSAQPPISAPDIWLRVHHEWIASVAEAVLPRSQYQALVKKLRNRT